MSYVYTFYFFEIIDMFILTVHYSYSIYLVAYFFQANFTGYACEKCSENNVYGENCTESKL